MAFTPVPWKRNLAKIPSQIISSLGQIDSRLIAVAATITLRPSEIESNFQHLEFPAEEATECLTLPLQRMGKYSTRNIEGWERKRTDLPKINKTFYWETPNFGDASTYGTHTHYQDRQVFPVEYFEPRNHQLAVLKLKEGSGVDAPSVFKISVTGLLDRQNTSFEEDLLFSLNLLQENIGFVGVFASDAEVDEYLRTIQLDWEVFPPGNRDDLIMAFSRGRKVGPNEREKITARIDFFSTLNPEAYLKGQGSLNSYIGAKFADDLVVFENMNYGNAIYVLYEDWETISRLPRSDIIRSDTGKVDRFVHNPGWEKLVRKLLQREKRKRRK